MQLMKLVIVSREILGSLSYTKQTIKVDYICLSSKVTRFSGDGGIDGIIDEDKQGLDKIYIQAKRWAKDNKVRQAFIGAMADRGGAKGVFITTSSFTQDAQNCHPNNYKIALIDGTRLD